MITDKNNQVLFGGKSSMTQKPLNHIENLIINEI